MLNEWKLVSDPSPDISFQVGDVKILSHCPRCHTTYSCSGHVRCEKCHFDLTKIRSRPLTCTRKLKRKVLGIHVPKKETGIIGGFNLYQDQRSSSVERTIVRGLYAISLKIEGKYVHAVADRKHQHVLVLISHEIFGDCFEQLSEILKQTDFQAL